MKQPFVLRNIPIIKIIFPLWDQKALLWQNSIRETTKSHGLYESSWTQFTSPGGAAVSLTNHCQPEDVGYAILRPHLNPESRMAH